jgi:hypothetical protein
VDALDALEPALELQVVLATWVSERRHRPATPSTSRLATS